MALLNSSQPSSVYVDPRAAVLYGAGNNTITPAQIKDYISAPGRSDKEILGAALANNVSTAQIAEAMKGNTAYAPEKISGYLSSQGISQEKTNPQPSPYDYKPIEYTPIANVNALQDPSKGTVAGQLTNVLDPNSQLMTRAGYMGDVSSNRRGLLNSSIGVSAAMAPMIDAGLQVATPDAASNNQFNLFNTQNQNDINKFNASNSLSAGVANAGNLKDYASLENQMNIANLDVNTKLKIANIDALSKDSNIAANLNQQLMSAIVEINKQDKPVDVRQAEIEQLVNLTTQSIGLLQSFDSKVPALKFDDIMGSSIKLGSGNTATGGNTGNSGAAGSGGSSVVPMSKMNPLNYDIEPAVLGNVSAYEKATGNSIDKTKIAPERLVNDIMKAINPSSGLSYIGSDGQTHMANANAYDLNALMKQTGAKNYGELFSTLFAPVYVPGTGRADQVMFYVYR